MESKKKAGREKGAENYNEKGVDISLDNSKEVLSAGNI